MPRRKKVAKFFGIDLSTTAFAVGVRSKKGQEDFVSVPIMGQTEWYGQPAFKLEFVSQMFIEALEELRRRGWVFGKKGALSFSVRQHDMVLLDSETIPLIPALSWQCNAAAKEMKELRRSGVQKTVGRIEERFILPKLIWALRQAPFLTQILRYVMTTGDFIALMLTNRFSLSTSDGLSNGLLNQKTKDLAKNVLAKAGLNLDWFPKPIQSGTVVGTVQPPSIKDKASISWNAIRNVLQGWQVIAGLGDNHSSGVGCGLRDYKTIVTSGGTSGTVVRKSKSDWKLAGKAACFEYYWDRLLLRMLADCAVWYDRFVRDFGEARSLKDLDQLALRADLTKLVKVRQRKIKDGWQEVYPKQWGKLGLAEKVASTQASIASELIILVDEMLCEISGVIPEITRFVLTGGISQSLFFQYAFQAGLNYTLGRPCNLFLSNHRGPLAHKSAALGAMINAMVGAGEYPNLSQAIDDLCPLKPVPKAPEYQYELLHQFFASHIWV